LPSWLNPTLLNDPVVQTAALPLLCATVVAILLRLVAGPGRGAALAGAGITIGFIAAYVTIIGTPSLEPRGSVQKLVYIAAGGLIVGTLVDLWNARRWIRWAALLGWPTLALAWLAENRLAQATVETWYLIGPIWAAMVLSLGRLEHAARREIDAGIVLLAFAIGLGAVALFGRSASLAQLALALAAALGGFLLLNWPRARFAFGASVVLGAGGTAVALAATLALFTGANRWALGALLLCLLADLLFRRVLPKSGALRAPILALCAGLPALAAGGIAYYIVRDSM